MNMTVLSSPCAAGNGGPYRLVTGLPPLTAFGRAVGHLMTRPAFANAPFGHVARGLAGQVNRGHYAFVHRGNDIVGFVGWAFVTEPVAEAWLAGERGFGSAEGQDGDCCVLNFWQADDPAVSRFLTAFLTASFPDKRRVYAKRHYPDGRIRPLRLDLATRTGRPEPIGAAVL
jgi:hemolysin-activating ACP:hemolysin acyltransferase